MTENVLKGRKIKTKNLTVNVKCINDLGVKSSNTNQDTRVYGSQNERGTGTQNCLW